MAQRLFVVVLLYTASPAFAQDGSGALVDIDLASAHEWTVSIDDEPARGIIVPGGGFNSDRQAPPWIEMCGDGKGRRMVKDHVMYQRKLAIPKSAEGSAILLEFGAVNHGAEVYLVDGGKETLVATHIGPHMPFAADLTGQVTPGREYLLKVKAFPMWHYKNTVPNGFIYQEGWTNPTNGWASKFSFGIAKYVRLRVYPPVRIRDVFVRPSVSKASLACDVWLENHSGKDHTVKLCAGLSSWNRAGWKYPSLPDISATVRAHSRTKVTIGPVNWALDNASYWWPNKPFREDYQPQLHNLKFSLSEKRKTLQTLTRRFGFVEWTEGPYYYQVNGVRMNFISDATPEAALSEYDCYSMAAAFLPPTAPGTGCPETWKRYMRLGICANRIHQSTPTEYMMNAADETGFLLIPETAIRGYQKQRWQEDNFTRAPKELAEVCRNHPSVCFYSLQNEENPAWVGALADAIVTVDDTRPLVFEDSEQNQPGAVFGRSGAHAYAMLHYRPAPTNATSMIVGMGESAWNGGVGERVNAPFLEKFAFEVLKGRCANWAYYSGWDWINYWPNFLQGMSATKHVWKQQYHEDRKDGLDGWDSPVIRSVQRAFAPCLVLDADFYFTNGIYSEKWPAKLPTCLPGQVLERTVQVFNDGLDGDELLLRWSLHWDSPQGPTLDAKEKRLKIKPGFHVAETIQTQIPSTDSRGERHLYLVLESVKAGRLMFHDESVCFIVPPTDHSVIDLSALLNPVWVSKDNLRDPSVLRTKKGYHLFYSRFSGQAAGWGDSRNWHIAEVFTKDFLTFTNDRDISPAGCASPGDVVWWHGRWVLPYQTYPNKPTQLVFAESTNLIDWSAPRPFLTEALTLPWNDLQRVIDPSFVVDGDTMHCWFVGSAYHTNTNGDKFKVNLMGHATTRDPKLEKWKITTFTAPLIGLSTNAPDGVENTMVFRTGDHWTMIYSEGLVAQHLARATSPNLVNWKLEGPVEIPRQKWMTHKYGAPFVWRDGDRWLMILMGAVAEDRTTFGLLSSTDGEHWSLLPERDFNARK